MLGQLIISGLGMGAVYALVGVGYSLAFRTLTLVNFAHMSALMFFTYLGGSVIRLGTSYVVGVMAIIPISFMIGGLGFEVALRPLMKRKADTMLVATVGLGIVVDSLVRMIWGTSGFQVAAPFGTKPLMFDGMRLQPQMILILVSTVVIGLLLAFVIRRTNVGTMLRATASDREIAQAFGVPAKNMNRLALGIATMLAAVAGLLFAPATYVDLGYGLSVGIKGFIAAILGGFGSLGGAVVGGVLVGVIESLAGGYVSTAYKYPIVFLVMMVVLMFRPHGLVRE